MFGASTASADNAASMQRAMNFAAGAGKELRLGAGTYVCTSGLTLPAGLKLRGAANRGSRLEKNFTTTGNNAFLSSSADGVDIEGIEIGASAYTIDGVKTNKLVLLTGNNTRVADCLFRTWSGWALTSFGSNVVISGNEFDDPLHISEETEGNGTDGIHIGGGSNIVVSHNTGEAADDTIAILTPVTGTYADSDISDVTVFGNVMTSFYARGFAVGVWSADLTSSVENVHAYDNEFTSEVCATGTIYVSSRSADGVVRNILIEGTTINGPVGEGSTAAISVRGGGTLEGVAFRNISGTGGLVNAIQTIDAFDGLSFEGVDFDASACSGPAFVVTSPNGATGLVVTDMAIAAGTGNGFSLALGATELAAPKIAATVTGVTDGKFALECNNVTNGLIDMVAVKAPGATTAGGVKEGGLASGNTILGDYSGVDIPYSGP